MGNGATLEPWTAQGESKREAVRSMFAEIAPNYDRLNGILSLSLHRRWREAAVAAIAPLTGQSALDVCCGTGDFLVPLRRAVGEHGRVAGLDFCPPMIRQAKGRGSDPGALIIGDACRLPFGTETFDAVTVGWGLRNVPDLSAALDELLRVLRPGGRFASLDMARTQGPVWGLFNVVTEGLGLIFKSRQAYRYLAKSTASFATPNQLTQRFADAGFVDVTSRRFFMGTVVLHAGRKP